MFRIDHLKLSPNKWMRAYSGPDRRDAIDLLNWKEAAERTAVKRDIQVRRATRKHEAGNLL